MKIMLLAALLVSATVQLPAQSAVSISSLGRTTIPAFGALTLTGSGFDPANAAISVVVVARDAVTITIPAVSATATSVGVVIPPLVNGASGELFDTPVVADVQVIQVSGTSVFTSNVLGGLTLEPAPATPGAAGSVTTAFLRTMLDVQADLRAAHSASAPFASVVASSRAFTDSQGPLIDAAAAVMTDRDRSVNLPTTDGLPLSVNARTFRIADRLILAFVRQSLISARVTGSNASGPAAEVPGGCQCGPTQADIDLCEFRRNPCVAHDAAKKVVPALAAGVYGTQLAFLAGWAAGGLGAAGVITADAATAMGFLWGQAISYATAVQAGADPPTMPSLLRDSATTIVDEHVSHGLGIFSGLNAGVSLGQEMEKVIVAAKGPAPTAPRGGAVLAGPKPSGASADMRPSFVYQGIGSAAKWLAVAATQQVTALATVTIPPTPVARFNGLYTGAAGGSCTVTTPDGNLTAGASAPIAATVSSGVLTVTAGGSGTGSVSPTGRFTSPSVGAAGITCQVGGRFWEDGTGRAGATGFNACAGAGVSCSGTWNLLRDR